MALGLDLPPGAGAVGYRMMCPILSYPELGHLGGRLEYVPRTLIGHGVTSLPISGLKKVAVGLNAR